MGTLIGSLSLQSGCSFLFVKGPPDNHTQLASVECSDSNAWPVLDVVWAGLNGIGAASVAGDDTNPNKDQIVGVGLAWLVVSGISAIYGFSKVSACGDAKRLHEQPYDPRQFAASPGSDAMRQCRELRRRALTEALEINHSAEQARLIKAAPVCDAPDDDDPPPATAPAAPGTPRPRPPAPPSPTPATSRALPRSPVPSRPLAMRPALASD